MKPTLFTKSSPGVGLIEVLITIVVVAVGLLAVASLQGDLISGSRSNKTRAEAQALADTKIEQLRDTIEKTGTTGYNALASSATNETIAGVTESFSRGWVVTDQTNPVRKVVSVSVCWPSASCADSVTVQSVIAFDGVGNSALAAKGAGAGATLSGPTLNAESSDEISENIELPPRESPYTPGEVVTIDDKTYIVQDSATKATRADLCSAYVPAITAFENNLFTRRIDHDGVSGKEAIELFEKQTISGQDYCIPRIRFNGGVIIPIRGIVHSGATTHGVLLDVNLFTFNATESGTYCVFSPVTGAKSAPYVCYVGGNCIYGPAGTHKPNGTTANPGDDTIVTECPNPASAQVQVGPGGWRGKVGLLGIATHGNNVCFAEEVAGAPATIDTARNYFTRNAGLNEGINKAYNCHDFLIINGKTTAAKIHEECLAQANAIGGFTLASKNIQRSITGNNVFDATVDTAYCEETGTSYTIVGTIVNASSAPIVTVTDSIITRSCTATTTSYTCDITTPATSVTISGLYNAEISNCTLSPPSGSGCALSFTTTTNPTYTISGNISGTSTAANAVSLTMSNGGVCTNNNNGTYTCSITTDATSVILTPSIATGGTVTPNTDQTLSLPGTTGAVAGPNFDASMAVTYTISGTISIGNHVVLTEVTAAVDTGFGTCTLTGTHADNTSDSYSCTVPAGPNNLTIAINPACSTGGSSKQYALTDNSTPPIITLGTGSLVIPFDNIIGNITKNITITKSSTGC